jgi:hypothetical protein
MWHHSVIPAKAGIQRAFGQDRAGGGSDWIPAFAGMTGKAQPPAQGVKT